MQGFGYAAVGNNIIAYELSSNSFSIFSTSEQRWSDNYVLSAEYNDSKFILHSFQDALYAIDMQTCNVYYVVVKNLQTGEVQLQLAYQQSYPVHVKWMGIVAISVIVFIDYDGKNKIIKWMDLSETSKFGNEFRIRTAKYNSNLHNTLFLNHHIYSKDGILSAQTAFENLGLDYLEWRIRLTSGRMIKQLQ